MVRHDKTSLSVYVKIERGVSDFTVTDCIGAVQLVLLGLDRGVSAVAEDEKKYLENEETPILCTMEADF